MRTPVRLSCDDNDILLKKAIPRISNVSKNSLKKFICFGWDQNEKWTGGKKLTTTWLTFTRAYLP